MGDYKTDAASDGPALWISATDDFFPIAIGAYIDFLAACRREADYEVRAVIDAKRDALMTWREDAMRWRDKYLDGKIAEREAATCPPELEPLAPLPKKPAVHPDRPVGDG